MEKQGIIKVMDREKQVSTAKMGNGFTLIRMESCKRDSSSYQKRLYTIMETELCSMENRR